MWSLAGKQGDERNVRQTEKFCNRFGSVLADVCFDLWSGAQEPNPTTVAPGANKANVVAQGPNGVYVYQVKVVQRELDAVNYLNRRGSTHVTSSAQS